MMTKKKYHTTTSKKKKAYMVNWRKRNPGYSTIWRKANPEKAKAYSVAYLKANPEKARACVVAYNKAHPEVIRAAVTVWRKKNPRYMVVWWQVNSERARTYTHTRRARVKNNGGKLSSNIVPKLRALQHNKCALCNKKLKEYHIDHIIPIFHSGSNTDDNVQLTCPTCNHKKGNKLPNMYEEALRIQQARVLKEKLGNGMCPLEQDKP